MPDLVVYYKSIKNWANEQLLGPEREDRVGEEVRSFLPSPAAQLPTFYVSSYPAASHIQ